MSKKATQSTATARRARIPVGLTQSGRQLSPEDALKVGLMYTWKKRNDFKTGLQHELLADATSASTIAYLLAKPYCTGAALDDAELRRLSASLRSMLLVSPIIMTLAGKFRNTDKNFKKFLDVYTEYKESGEKKRPLSQALHELDLELEALPDNIAPEDFDDAFFDRILKKRNNNVTALDLSNRAVTFPLLETKKAAWGLVDTEIAISSFIYSTLKEVGHYIPSQGGASKFVKAIGENFINLSQTFMKEASQTKSHIAYSLGSYFGKQSANDNISEEEHNVEIATGKTAMGAAWTEIMTGFQIGFMMSEFWEGIALAYDSAEAARSPDSMDAVGLAVKSVLHIFSAAFSIKPAHELIGSFSHNCDQMNGLRAQKVRINLEKQRVLEEKRLATEGASEALAELQAEEEALEADTTPPTPN